MNKYVYQIQGMLETAQGRFGGLRVLVCNVNYFDSVDVPSAIFDKELKKYMEFRLRVYEHMDIQRLPIRVQYQIRTPLGKWLDRWVLDNFYGNTSKSKSTDTGLLETGKQNPAG
jgi:hypothetical protein